MTDDTPPEPRPAPGTITQLLDEAREGDGAALDRAWGILYQELRAVAQNLIKGDRLQKQIDATELIGEIWIKGRTDPTPPKDRRQFFARAFRHMSQELIDRARREHAAKRGGGWTRRPLEVVTGELASLDRLAPEQREAAGLAMDAWQSFETKFPDEATVGFCRLGLGLGNTATAKLLECTPKEAERRWYLVRAHLRVALDRACSPPDAT